MLSLNNCSLPAEMQVCSQWRGFNLWRGEEGKDRGCQRRCRLSICSLLSLWLMKGLEPVLQWELGSDAWAFLKGKECDGLGPTDGLGSTQNWLRESFWDWKRGMKTCESSLLLLLPYHEPDIAQLTLSSREVRWEGEV